MNPYWHFHGVFCCCCCVCVFVFFFCLGNLHVFRTTKIHKNKLINGFQFWQLQEDRWESNMLLAACYQLGGTSASPLCGTLSWNRHWQMTQPLTVKPVQADSSTCTQAGPLSALELNQPDLQNVLAFIFPLDVRWAGGITPSGSLQPALDPRTYIRELQL